MERDVKIREAFEFNFVILQMFHKALPVTPHSLGATCQLKILHIYLQSVRGNLSPMKFAFHQLDIGTYGHHGTSFLEVAGGSWDDVC